MSLVYVDDSMPGISRRPFRGKFAFYDPRGQRIADRDELRRLNAIALPPAYTDTWYAPSPDAHILATGIDAKGRKQYRYHPDFRAERENAKFDSCSDFGRFLPLIRARVDRDLHSGGLGIERAIASIVRLLDTGGIRVGNESYVKANKSYGATTLRMKHAALKGGTLHLSFKAKSGKHREMRVSDKGLARFVRKMQDLPGQHLFQYIDDDGRPAPVTSSDVNAYIRETMGGEFTAKHFRTWAASALAFDELMRAGNDVALKPLLETVSDRLGNTPTIARQSYIHPAVLSLAEDADARASLSKLPRATRWLSRAERGLLDFLDADKTETRRQAA